METKTTLLHLLYYLSMLMLMLMLMCGTKVSAIELPKYTIILSESDFQIRLYNESSWMSARVSGTSFEQASKTGFHRLYEYIHGANSDSSKIAFTAPVLTSVPSSPPGDGYTVRMFISSHFEGNPPTPNPELKLGIEKWKPQCFAVRKFSGYAKDDNINKEFEALVTSLNKHSVKIQDTSSYIIAQYNASFHNTTDRLNQVWIKVSQLGADC
ncbi:heme-binding protein 2 [Cajanus cajan]|uniref:Heme-binding protein 2 n=1 Tax=Cajanus cajan TaxID=3821 RepID=A0A151RQ71_CAJCA|nr:heme-binding protein 2 [Cajanus cajan]KYP44696.1 Heme-binding protein 2 [Cajanus cajan]